MAVKKAASRKGSGSARGRSQSRATRGTRTASTSGSNRPAFPYTTRPNALRRFLDEVPRRPRPQRVNAELLASWGLGGGENNTIIRVLKTLGLVNSNNEPTDSYTAYMRAGAGPAVLGGLVRQVYSPLFGAAHEPQRETNEGLRNLFNIHSSGAPGTIEYQIQTFKALCDYASFDQAEANGTNGTASTSTPATIAPNAQTTRSSAADGGVATIHIDLHIHLPEGKSSRDYQYIIQDIARFIYGRESAGSADRDSRP